MNEFRCAMPIPNVKDLVASMDVDGLMTSRSTDRMGSNFMIYVMTH